ncbi:phage tail sheath family protein [Collimonas humicola]|uniref:phage tail sheath family protein n=1 Tax=Collimonas humicola TaxID=2825886 RepID=UPI001B8D50FD|nr:phage tail sheath family protein [Collimonas humicola]
MPISTSNLSPGVYVEEVNSLLLSIPAGATAIPVFIGQFRTLNGSVVDNAACLRVENWLDFTKKYGDSANMRAVLKGGDLEQDVKSKKKGGANAVTRVLAPDEYTVTYTAHLGSLSVRHYFENGGGPCYILSVHNRGDDTEHLAMETKIARCPDISLICLCEATSSDEAMYNALSGLLNRGEGYFLLADSIDGETRPSTPEQHTAVYFPALQTAYSPRPDDKYIYIGEGQNKTLFSLIESDPSEEEKAEYAAVSAAIDAFVKNEAGPVYLRATPAVAGAYCKTDRERGVWKAPANITLSGVRGLYDHSERGGSTTPIDVSKGINQIRYFSDRGAVIWGARTMVPQETPTWLYIPVRRLFNAAERDIKAAMRFAIFEPNSQSTWEAVRAAVDNYLYGIWRDGALAGATQEEAYFVAIGKDITMTDADIAEGKMIVKIGMAAVRPAEFIILEFTQDVMVA